mmetsp:Transcript_30257/g.70666  ORF Transcript_30257/g.70666 Transcript_30257/m.70666 type:complete len:488 (-) Transcript_30257:370-1833(-)
MSSVSDDYRKVAVTLSKDQAVHYKELGSAWAAANGFVVMRPSGLQVAPCSLTPSPFPSKVYKQCKDLVPDFGQLIYAVSKDHEFINKHLAPVAESDEFQKRLLEIFNKVREEGVRQKVSLAILRSDYMLHDSGDGSPLQPRQVEINTIASSFAALSEKATTLHSFLLSRSPVPPLDPKNCPSNAPIENIASGIAQASNLYAKSEPPATGGAAGARRIGVLFVVQPEEGNVFDQRHLEFRLFDKHSLPVIRATLAQIEAEASLDEGSRRLLLRGFEISVIYFRAGYAPTDYNGDTEWSARLKMERSAAIKCPTAAYQCVGAKKIQQVLAAPGETEKFVDTATAKRIRASYAGLYPLGDGSEEAKQAKERAIQNPDRYVLKPQREGGGNNLYDQEMKQALETMSDHELQAYILMDIIQAPQAPAVFMRDGNEVACEGIAELGTYGVSITNDKKIQRNDYAGHLLRSKMASSKEAGVAAGFGVIDSPYLY